MQLPLRLDDRRPHVGGGGRGHVGEHEVGGRALDEDAGGLPVGVALDGAAGRVGRPPPDARTPQGLGVHDRVVRPPVEVDGPAPADPVEVVAIRQPAFAQVLDLEVRRRDHPPGAGMVPDPRGDRVEDLVDAGDGADDQPGVLPADLDHVEVRVDETRDRDAGHVWTGQATGLVTDVRPVADGGDHPVAHEDGVGEGPGGVERAEATARHQGRRRTRFTRSVHVAHVAPSGSRATLPREMWIHCSDLSIQSCHERTRQ
ncbi:hypothetical protein BJF78_00795 [Pseudonocardia sp. CNS-139]|nr:hypothetical protein BJF78_00795 [Pseudonocardia sp. CNS-139]